MVFELGSEWSGKGVGWSKEALRVSGNSKKVVFGELVAEQRIAGFNRMFYILSVMNGNTLCWSKTSHFTKHSHLPYQHCHSITMEWTFVESLWCARSHAKQFTWTISCIFKKKLYEEDTFIARKEISIYYEATSIKGFSDLPEIMYQLMESFG